MTAEAEIARIRSLQAEAGALEPGPRARDAARQLVTTCSEGFLESLDGAPPYRVDRRAALELREVEIGEGPTPLGPLLEQIERSVIEPGLKPASGGHLAYIPGGGLFLASLGDELAAVTNEYAGVRHAGPGAVELEDRLLRWMAELVGLPQRASGHLTSGGSLANLAAIVAAREAQGLAGDDLLRAVVYLSPQTHHCVDKALRIAGLGQCHQRRVELDAGGRIEPAALERSIAEDRDGGLIPSIIVASAGTTDVGAIDPLEAIGAIARDQRLWFHVDAAYGGFFALCDEVRPRLRGMAAADSVVMDPHKGLFLPYGLGALLVRDEATLRRAFGHRAAYLQDFDEPEEGERCDPADRSPELTKHFRGLRMWLPLLVHGVAPFRAALEEKLALARYFRRRVGELGFEVGPEPDLSVVTYRWVPTTGDANAFNRALIDEVLADGRVFLSSTTIEGRVVLRLAVLSFRSHLDIVDLALEVLAEKVALLESR